ncbi:hypothetical protein CAPTEDRAFT_187144 [Capitella teleta]|uniref:UvrD-like helicase C-terminal domain-containing protein n=1 Tax=Capitella teleta TaxID=283909 RepID=R7V6Y5_CAPTE|nr:hypothetical protein CAPTEDRAFT_187144 [Capitella teleta]|eukprot:ELU14334.1 hypothetical protein CAPTEDRAFT_187144 [Capitella teleta]
MNCGWSMSELLAVATPTAPSLTFPLNAKQELVCKGCRLIYLRLSKIIIYETWCFSNISRLLISQKSFRFGPEISWVAAMCLDLLKNERKKLLVGSSTRGCVSGEKVGPMAIICRTNFTVFSEAVRECCFCNDNMRCAFAGGIDNFGFDVILDILVLFQNHSEEEMEATIQNRLIRRFIRQGFSEFVKFAKKTTDSELLGKIKIVEVFHNSLPGYIKMIRSKCVRDVDLADIIFSTAHKAKGLEFSTVRVANDFNIFNIDGRMHSLSEVSIDERNLLYVAVTRAKKSLILSSTIVKLLELYGDHHLSVISSKVLKEKGVNFKCKVSGEEFEPGSLTLYHEKYVLSDKTTQSAHVLSPETVGNLKQVASFAQILGTNFVQMEEFIFDLAVNSDNISFLCRFHGNQGG